MRSKQFHYALSLRTIKAVVGPNYRDKFCRWKDFRYRQPEIAPFGKINRNPSNSRENPSRRESSAGRDSKRKGIRRVSCMYPLTYLLIRDPPAALRAATQDEKKRQDRANGGHLIPGHLDDSMSRHVTPGHVTPCHVSDTPRVSLSLSPLSVGTVALRVLFYTVYTLCSVSLFRYVYVSLSFLCFSSMRDSRITPRVCRSSSFHRATSPLYPSSVFLIPLFLSRRPLSPS